MPPAPVCVGARKVRARQGPLVDAPRPRPRIYLAVAGEHLRERCAMGDPNALFLRGRRAAVDGLRAVLLLDVYWRAAEYRILCLRGV